MANDVTLVTLDKKIDEAVDDLSNIIKDFAGQVDLRFNRLEDDMRELKEEQKRTREDIRRIFDYIDSVAKSQEINDDERLVMGHQLDRLDHWVHELAKKIGVELSA